MQPELDPIFKGRKSSVKVREKSNDSESANKPVKFNVTPLSMTHSHIMSIMNKKRSKEKFET